MRTIAASLSAIVLAATAVHAEPTQYSYSGFAFPNPVGTADNRPYNPVNGQGMQFISSAPGLAFAEPIATSVSSGNLVRMLPVSHDPDRSSIAFNDVHFTLTMTLPPCDSTSGLRPFSVTTAAAVPRALSSKNVDSPVERVDAPASLPAAVPPPDRFEIRFTAKADTVDTLKMVQDLLSHAVPNGDLAEVFDRALTALAEELLRKKFAVTRTPRKTLDSPSEADAPAAVKRAVYLHDRGRCTYVSKDGRRCESRRFLQFDHVVGRAVGGGFTVDNVRLRCGPHNRLEAERLYATPPGARHAGGARVDVTRVHDRPGKRCQDVVTNRPPVPGRTTARPSSEGPAITT